MARLAITKDVLSTFAKLDKTVQGAVEAAIARFADVHTNAYLEKVPGRLDDRIRLLRLDDSWYGVVLVPDNGDTYCLLAILPINEAVGYATSHRVSVNQATGVLEVSNSAAIQEMQPSLQTAAGPNGTRLFADVSDADLTRLGIDVHVRPLVRLLANDADLDALQPVLPTAQYIALHALASGMTVEEALAEMAPALSSATPSGQVHGDDLVAAMERTPDQIAFVSGQEELQLILAHPFAAWRTFLHPSQREIAYRPSYSGPAQVTGGPGTGKTVTVLHRAAFLAARAASASETAAPGAAAPSPGPDAVPVLLTTFNGNLADALHAQLDLLVRDADVRRQIQVLNVDRLVYSIVKQARGTPVIADERVLRARWTEAAAAVGLDLTPAFLKNEWEQVILGQDLRNEQAYLTCLRSGRGRPLTKAQRSLVWQAAQRVTAELAAARQSTHLQLANEATRLLREAGGPRYRHILVDEAQDLHPAQWRLLRAAVAEDPDDLFIAADPHQRIYNNRVSLASLRISVRGRSRKLSLNYRTTQEILAWAMPLLGPDPVTGLDGEIDSLLGYRSPMRGQRPQVRLAATRSEEFALLSERIRAWLVAGLEPNAIGVTARSAGLLREAREALKADGIETTSVSGRGGGAGVRAGTMHAMKGLEFQAVAVIGVEPGVVPGPTAVTAEDEDPVAHAQDLQRERCVLFVACTRARDHLYVSAAGQPSVFLPRHDTAVGLPETRPAQAPQPAAPAPPQPRQSADPPAADHDAVVLDGSGEPQASDAPGVRKLSMPELLRRREEAWAPRLRGASLVAEVDLGPDHTRQVAEVLARLYRKLPDPQLQGESFLLRWPACLAAAMAGVAAENFQGGMYWPVLWTVTGFDGNGLDQGVWGRAFNRAVERLGMATFPGLPLTYVGPILMHAGLPNFCLRNYFQLLLDRRRHDPGMDAESFLAWATAPGRERRLNVLHVPARRFLTQGGDYALDVVDRSLDLLGRLADPDPDLDGVRLPARFVEVAKQEVVAQGAGNRGSGTGRQEARSSASRPRIALDPYGAGVQIILPAVGEAPDGVATWRVTADGDPTTVRSRAQWVGAAEAAPETVHPLPRPVRTVQVSLVGWDHTTELDVVQPADPVLFFADDGRRLPARLPLPPDHVWILRPADRELVVLGELRIITETPVPFGWEGWHLQLASLDKVRSLSLAGGPAHAVQGFARPRLLLGAPVPGVTTPYGSPVYPQPPPLWLPDVPDSEISWRVEIRTAAEGTPLMSREISQSGAAEIWESVPRPILGAFDITVRGPLGRGMRRTVFVAEGLSVSYRPDVRALKVSGLEPGEAELRVPVGAFVRPPRLAFRATDRAHVAELRAGAETEPVVITPPHVEVLCAGAGAGAWTAAPVHAASEDISDLGRLLVRAPGRALTAELEVWAGLQPVQTIPPSGGQAAGLAGYELPRASETVAHHGRAEFFLPWGHGRMPVGMVRPRRLATGTELSDGLLIIRDCVPVDGLTAALYLARAPWRAPVIVPVPAEGMLWLPPEVRNAGPLRVLLRVEDPWVVTDWPDWPGRGSYACDAPGMPAGGDAEEAALCRFVAADGDLPASPARLDRLWLLIHLADDLRAAGASASLRERCSAVLAARPGAALTALLDAGLDPTASVAGLISTGLATARPLLDGDLRKVERLWGVLPPAAAVLCSRLLAEPAPADDDPSATLLDAALAQCGANLEAVLGGNGDPASRVGQFGPAAERLALLPPPQVDAVWQAAVVVPQALLDADTRAVAARQMFDARRALAGPARDATIIVRNAEMLVTASPYRDAAALIAARRHPERKGGWLALPAMSASLALVARVAARGNEACRVFERGWRPRWADLARQAPELASIDLVLAEALIAGMERTRFAEEAA